jgi:hypothetical protein
LLHEVQGLGDIEQIYSKIAHTLKQAAHTC